MSCRHGWIACASLIAQSTLCHADIFRWDNGQLIPGTEVITPGPEVQLNDRELEFADLSGINLTDANFELANLSNARLWSTTLTNANLSGAVVAGTIFLDTTSRGFTREQLYSTASYQSKDLRGVHLSRNNLSGWDFAGQNLTARVCTSPP